MTTEQNEPQGFVESQAAFPPPAAPASNSQQGQQANGQSHSSRRRRRRKKGKQAGQQQNPPNGQPAQQSAPQASAPPQNQQGRKQKSRDRFQKQNYSNNGNGYGNGNGNGQQGGRRKQKQRKQHTFVGPMDHSYRTVNGNIADGPPSTIEFRNGNANGNIAGYMDAPYEAPVTVREDAPTRIYCFIDDLFFLAKINEVSRKTGIKVGFLKGTDKEVLTRLTDLPEDERPSLIIFDLNNANVKPLTLIPKIKAKLKRGTSVIGFLSHVQGDLKVKAIEAGCDTVMPRSAFSQNLPNLLRRHGLDEELEAVEA
jgi:hypothetical protein